MSYWTISVLIAFSMLYIQSSTARTAVALSSTHGSLGNISTRCSGCKTACLDDVCYPRNFGSVMITGKCPVSACDSQASNTAFYIWTDGCPICVSKNGGPGYKNPCQSQQDCDGGSQCVNNLCTYANVDASELASACVLDTDCPEDQFCSKKSNACTDGAAQEHQRAKRCVFQRHCPSGYYCNEMKCYKNYGQAPDHIPDLKCVFTNKCPSGYMCDDMTCVKDPRNRRHIQGRSCAHDGRCPPGYICDDRTCFQGY